MLGNEINCGTVIDPETCNGVHLLLGAEFLSPSRQIFYNVFSFLLYQTQEAIANAFGQFGNLD